MAYELPKLAYAYDALAPHIDARTMEIHHDRHHQAYVTGLNTALEKAPDLQGKPAADLLKAPADQLELADGAVRVRAEPARKHTLAELARTHIWRHGGEGIPRASS